MCYYTPIYKSRILTNNNNNNGFSHFILFILSCVCERVYVCVASKQASKGKSNLIPFMPYLTIIIYLFISTHYLHSIHQVTNKCKTIHTRKSREKLVNKIKCYCCFFELIIKIIWHGYGGADQKEILCVCTDPFVIFIFVRMLKLLWLFFEAFISIA